MSEKQPCYDSKTVEFYDDSVHKTFPQYNSIASPYIDSFRDWFTPGGKILDVGCGSGRDVYALLDQGYKAYGMDPSKKGIQGLTLHKNHFQWGSLPEDIPSQWDIEGGWDGILCSAVFQHIPDTHLFDVPFTLSRLVKQGGRVVVIVPIEYPNIRDDRDGSGRLFRLRPTKEYIFHFERLGFHLIKEQISPDSLGRPQTRWAQLVFVKREAGGVRPIDTLESFIREDAKVSSYKFALLRALGELSSSTAGMGSWYIEPGSGAQRVRFPLDPLVLKWFEYYWPLLESPKGDIIFQGQNNKGRNDILFRPELLQLKNYWEEKGDGWRKFKRAYESESFDPFQKKIFQDTYKRIQDAMVKGPIKYMGNQVFGTLKEQSHLYITIPAELWTELCLMGRWFEDSIMFRWAEFCGSRTHQSQGVDTALVLQQMISMKELGRQTSIPKQIYEQIAQKHHLHCVWSGKPLSIYDLDHAIPYSLWHNNALWNLFPADKRVNNQKRAKLPTRSFLLSREKSITEYWDRCFEEEPCLFKKELSSLTGESKYNSTIKHSIFCRFSQQVEILAAQNVVERWEI